MFAYLLLLMEMSQKLEKLYPRVSKSWRKYAFSVMVLLFFCNKFAINLPSFQQVHYSQYCSVQYFKAVVIALAVALYMKSYAKEHWRARPW